ncbi:MULTISPECIES: DUF5060 domain-containing protein [Clostridia]|uniref:DUF5060 domain-containing protein n=1 Tax=Clostridia TaxID=186801 RepID=UPI00067EA106|nr:MULTISPECIES: DUF5060 domain-containing protein [Clostridia]
MLKGYVWKPFEICFKAGKEYQDAFNEVDMDVVISDEKGKLWNIPAFWAGGDLWKARFSAPQPGLYTYTTRCSCTEDQGLNGQEGEFTIKKYTGGNPLYVHGPIQVMDNGRYFEHQDKTPFAWLGDTWWNMESSRMSENGEIEYLAEDRVRKGFTVIAVVNGFWCDLNVYDERMKNAAGFAWNGRFDTINPDYYNIVDKKIEQITDAGLVISMAATWGFYLAYMGVEKMKKHVRYMIARYAAYPIVWLTAGESLMPFYDEMLTEDGVYNYYFENKGRLKMLVDNAKTEWTEIIEYMKETDPYNRLLTIHTRVNEISTDVVTKPELLDFIVFQAGRHSDDLAALVPQTADCTSRALKQEPNRPVVNSECCYEGMMYQCGSPIQRWIFWHSVLTGCAGWTYGANGMFTANHEHEEFGLPHYKRCWGEQTWQEAVHFEGARHVGNCRKYLNRYEWWRLKPLDDIVEEPEGISDYEKTVSAEIEGELIMAYMQRDVVKASYSKWPWIIRFKNLKPGTRYRIKAYNPIRNYEVILGENTVDGAGKIDTGVFPMQQDWLVILEQD